MRDGNARVTRYSREGRVFAARGSAKLLRCKGAGQFRILACPYLQIASSQGADFWFPVPLPCAGRPDESVGPGAQIDDSRVGNDPGLIQ